PAFRQYKMSQGYKDVKFVRIDRSNCLYSAQTASGSWSNFTLLFTTEQLQCPSATQKDLKVSINSKSYVCVAGCQYRLRACVDVDIEPGMTCSAISTGQD